MTAAALAAIMLEIAMHGLPDLQGRNNISHATHMEMTESTPYGPVAIDVPIVHKDGSLGTMPAMSPLAFLWKIFRQGGTFVDFFLDLHNKNPSTPDSPWSIILYSDEVVPGNQLSHSNDRKHWVMYWSWMQLGAAVLQHEESWLPCLLERSTIIADLSGGMSQAFAIMLKLFFGGLQAFSFNTGGIVLNLPDGSQFRSQ